MYYNYHAQIKKRLRENKLFCFKVADEYNGIRPALLLVFEDGKVMPVRQERWDEYFSIIEELCTEPSPGPSDLQTPAT